MEKTLKYQLNESYAEGFDDARKFIAELIDLHAQKVTDIQSKVAFERAAEIARKLK